MGVYIKGMEMPKEGSWATVRIYPDGTCAVPNWQGDCTLIRGAQAVPVPAHGREDLRTQPGLPRQGPGRELKVQMSDYYSRQDILAFLRSYRCSTDIAFHMEDHLSEVPAADVRPVVRGKWIPDYDFTEYDYDGSTPLPEPRKFQDGWQCSLCGGYTPSETNFCPNCGADMREKS